MRSSVRHLHTGNGIARQADVSTREASFLHNKKAITFSMREQPLQRTQMGV